MIKNANPRQNPITTIPGICFIVLGFLMYALPMFMEVKKDFTEIWYIPLVVISIGLLLIFSPDSLAKALLKGVNKKVDE